jgi:penicillin-binding protein 1A
MGAVTRPVRFPLVIVIVAACLGLSACEYTPKIPDPGVGAISSKVLYDNGQTIATLHALQNRDPVALSAIAPTLQTAVVAIEDQRYWQRGGVDLRAIVRAVTDDVNAGKDVQGGSTITQQYVRNVILNDTKQTFSRKLREAVISVEIEQKFSKTDILDRYLNAIYFGNGAYGIQAASRLYFGVDAKTLNLAQSALLAGLIQSPEGRNPYKYPAAARTRRNVVLDKLKELRREPAADIAAARAAPLDLMPLSDTTQKYPAPYFVEQVKSFILSDPAFGNTLEERRHALFEGGLNIETTLDPRLQQLAESSIASVLTSPATDPSAGLVTVDPANGHVLAYVGGLDYFGTAPYAKYDLAGQAQRQPGSSFKPYVLAAALEAGIPLTKEYSAPVSIDIPVKDQPVWHVPNFPGTPDGGTMDLVDATVHSVNTVYAQLIGDVGPQRVVDLAHAAGVTATLDPIPSIALGTEGVSVLDMASGFSTFAADGMHAAPVFVTKVTNHNGTVLYSNDPAPTRAIPATVVRELNGVLQQVLERGTGVNARIGRAAAGKTGTTDNNANAWFVGYTPQLSTAVWIGFADAYRPMVPPTTRIRVDGGTWPADIWQRYMAAALATTPSIAFPSLTPPVTTTTGGGVTTTSAPATALSVVGMALGPAKSILTADGYRVATVDTPTRDEPPGTVVTQSPADAAALPAGATVTLGVAVKPVPVAVPSVLGLTAVEARAALVHAGLVANIVTAEQPPPVDPTLVGRAWKQSSIAATTVDSGTTITVTVNPDA